ncbi:hypothetical protein N9R04_03500 [Staphylococcus sp. SQ8-PEA]|uniref:Uncharacterized protein n=1 Tax=Staphylococcus marylandisciuri TaxID=2981529 RepID=A0ABT2QPA2_9STAP|nr:hypothetical protein [Staphylococcus marylandisciuri]
MNIILVIIVIFLLQLLTGYLFYRVGFHLFKSILLILLPLGLGIFILQLFYFERHYPKWELPLLSKMCLKYIYIITFLEYVAFYIFIFKF